MFSTRTVRYVEVLSLAILVFAGFTTACGPGRRRESSSRKMRKMTPLVYKQHVPNVSENTIGASGQPDGAIRRGDPRFKDLVENHDINVIFRDEERDGSDRIMSKRCKEKLEILADLVQNQWPGKTPEDPPVKVKVKEAWDDDHLHGENSLHYEGRAVDVSTNDRDRSKLGVLARLAVNAGFDWVFYESHGHIHCSVKSDSSAAIKRGGCFTGDSVVHVENLGYIPMSDMRIGDRVMSMRSDGKMEYSEVITFMDRDDNGHGLFYKIHTDSGKHLTLTGKHLVYVLNEASTVNFENYDIVFADTVTEGQYLLLKEKDTVIATAVTSVTVETRKGIYAPLTKHGTIVVDDFIASCYAYIDNVFIAHAVFAPMRIYHDISQYIPAQSWISSENTVQNNRNTTDLPVGMHWYASLLYEVGTRILSRDLLRLH